jgi:hypothetical protein
MRVIRFLDAKRQKIESRVDDVAGGIAAWHNLPVATLECRLS